MAGETLSIARTSAVGLGAIADSFTVTDGTGTPCFTFRYHMHIASQEWTVSDSAGAEIGTMSRHAHMHPTFNLERPGRDPVTIRKADFMPTHQTWQIDGAEGGDVTISGSFNDHEFTFTNAAGQQVAEASRRWVSVHDGYGVQLNGLDGLIAACAAIAIDVAEHEDH